MRLLISAVLLLLNLIASAQSGNFFLSHYAPNKDRLDNVCFQIAQDTRGVMYFATRGGLLNFDGRTWELIGGNGAVYTIQVGDDNTIYWGGANGFGVLGLDDEGLPSLVKLSENARDIFQSTLTSTTAYFANEDQLFLVDVKSKVVSKIEAPVGAGTLTGIFQISDDIYVTTSSNRLYQVGKTKLVLSTLIDSKAQIIFVAAFNERYLIGTSNSEVLLFQKSKPLKKVRLQDQEYLKESVILSGSWVNEDLIVLGTLRGGLVFVNLSTGTTHEIVNYATGLPDNEVYALVTDKGQRVWAAHEYGFTCIAPYLPFRSFSHYPGLSGNLLCAISHQNSVYVGTSLGLFRLEKEDTYQERQYYEKEVVKDRRKPAQETTSKAQPTDGTEETGKRGFLNLFKKRNAAPEKETSTKSGAQSTSVRRSSRKVLKTERVLVTSTYRYKKVSNIDAKVTQLAIFNGKLIACGLGGTYEINGLSAKMLLSDPTRHVFGSKDNILFASTYSDEVRTLLLKEGRWISLELLNNLHDQITQIFDGRDGETWLCALDRIYNIRNLGEALPDVNVIEIENPDYDQFAGIQLGDETILANSGGFLAFSKASNSFNRIDSLATELITYFARNESIWYRHSHGWDVFGKEYRDSNLGLLNLFQKIRFISPDAKTQNLWIITNTNELYKYFPDRVRLSQQAFPLFLKSVKAGETVMVTSNDIEVEQDNSRLTIEVVKPDYLGSNAVEYRYLISGLETGWTDWSYSNNLIEIPYLPAGDYSLEVEARDVFGQLSTLEIVKLNVVPPYWKRPWFYALEVVVFSLLVILSFRLSTRYRIISRLLMLLTIIMLIQFVETIIGQTFETSSPVIDFLIQVVIAMMVLPVEGYLRELMLRSLDTNNRFYRFIAPKTIVSRSPDDESE